MRRFLSVLALVLIAPLVAEVLAGSSPLSQPIVLVFDLLIYGPGALLIRELVRRSGRGWWSILLLGAAYGIIEEGLALQSFFNPALYNATGFGARVLGVNMVYMEAMLIYHPVWSVAVPILLAELLFPDLRSTPWLGWLGLVVTAIFYVLGVLLLMFSAHTSLAPGYWAPPTLLSLAGLAALVLVLVGLVALPRAAALPVFQESAPSPWVALLVSGVGGFATLALLILLRRIVPAFMQSVLVLIPMLGAVAIVAVLAWLVRRWSQARDWGDMQRLALAGGALIANTLAIGVLDITEHSLIDRVGVVAVGFVVAILLGLFAIRLRVRASEKTPARSVERRGAPARR